MPSTRIESIATAVPRHQAPQGALAEWAKRVAGARAAEDVGTSLRTTHGVIDRIYRNSAIGARASVVPDYTRAASDDAPDFVLYPPNWQLEPVPSTAARMRIYRDEAPRLATAAARRCLDASGGVGADAVSHLIVVSCTGFSAPGLDADLVRALGLRPDVERLVIGFMGCYAAFNALRAADAICAADPAAVVLVVCVELCSLHFQREPSMNNIVVNGLFADGAAAVLVQRGRAGEPERGFELLDSCSRLAEGSADQMTWTISDTGFQMSLDSDVPQTLRDNVAPFVDTLLGRNGLARADVEFWAVHPGGRRIVEVVRDRLALSEADAAPSFEVLAEHGNMSSPTILFVLERVLARRPRAGAAGVALAFGPGLTLESALLRAL